MNKPLYTLQVNTVSSCFEIKVNDIPLYNERKGKPTSAEIPINHLLVPGINHLKVTISPSKSEVQFQNHTKTDFEVYLREIDQIRTDRHQIVKLQFPDYIHNESLRSSIIHAETEFQGELPFIPTWSKNENIVLSANIIEEANSVYKKYFNALKQHGIDKIFELTKIKDEEFAKSYFIDIDDQHLKLRDSYSELFLNPKYELIDFDIQTKTTSLHGFGKLITITNNDFRSPLQFYNSETFSTRSFPIYLGTNNNSLKIYL